MRPVATRLHRYAGLLTAAFLFFSGVTGAVISWDHELDEWLNPRLNDARTNGPALPSLDIARQIEAQHPQVQVSFVPLAAEPGHSLAYGVEPRIEPANGKFYTPGFNQVFIDPASGVEHGLDLGVRQSFTVDETRLTARSSVENVTDERYWVGDSFGGLTWQIPRTYLVSITASF